MKNLHQHKIKIHSKIFLKSIQEAPLLISLKSIQEALLLLTRLADPIRYKLTQSNHPRSIL